MVSFETETWVPNKHYAMAEALAELLKLRVLAETMAQRIGVVGLNMNNRWGWKDCRL